MYTLERINYFIIIIIKKKVKKLERKRPNIDPERND